MEMGLHIPPLIKIHRKNVQNGEQTDLLYDKRI